MVLQPGLWSRRLWRVFTVDAVASAKYCRSQLLWTYASVGLAGSADVLADASVFAAVLPPILPSAVFIVVCSPRMCSRDSCLDLDNPDRHIAQLGMLDSRNDEVCDSNLRMATAAGVVIVQIGRETKEGQDLSAEPQTP